MKTAIRIGSISFAFLIGSIFAPETHTQGHAPTVDVCRADRAAWSDTTEHTDYLNQETKHISNGVRNTNPILKLPVKEISLRMAEMGACMSVDSPNTSAYLALLNFYDGVLMDRYRRFVIRHHLLRQFQAEDAAGIR